MSDGFTFTASCPRCGSELLTDEQPSGLEAPDLAYHDARCDRCLDVYRVTVSLCLVEPWPTDRLDREARRMESAAYADQILEAGRIG